jgi:hypothetical protein
MAPASEPAQTSSWTWLINIDIFACHQLFRYSRLVAQWEETLHIKHNAELLPGVCVISA